MLVRGKRIAEGMNVKKREVVATILLVPIVFLSINVLVGIVNLHGYELFALMVMVIISFAVVHFLDL